MEQEQFKKEILPLREKLFLYARRLLDNPEDAEDVMQEVFLKLWYMRGELDYYNNVMALSVQITKHLCLNRMKVRERMKHVDGFEVEEIAGLTGSTPEAVRMNLSRARKRVREQFFKMQTL